MTRQVLEAIRAAPGRVLGRVRVVYPIRFETETRRVRRFDVAIDNLRRAAAQFVAKRIVCGAVAFVDQRIGGGAQQMDTRGGVNRTHAGVRRERAFEGGREIGDFLALGDAACLAGVGLDDVDGAGFEQFARFEPREMVLAPGQRYQGALVEVRVIGDAVGGERFFEPEHAAFLESRQGAL